eukprot:3519475-Pleurochrysis_carterae.AAC.1
MQVLERMHEEAHEQPQPQRPELVLHQAELAQERHLRREKPVAAKLLVVSEADAQPRAQQRVELVGRGGGVEAEAAKEAGRVATDAPRRRAERVRHELLHK